MSFFEWFLEAGVNRKGVRVNCDSCGCSFMSRLKPLRQFCSRKCASHSRRKKILLKCAQCGVFFERAKSRTNCSKHKIYFCSRSCKDAGQSLSGDCHAIRPKHYGMGVLGIKSPSVTNLVKAGCVNCGLTTPFLLFVHHIDGNRKNNKIENIEVVCANHHAIRHLKKIDSSWIFSTSSLTPRKFLDYLCGALV